MEYMRFLNSPACNTKPYSIVFMYSIHLPTVCLHFNISCMQYGVIHAKSTKSSYFVDSPRITNNTPDIISKPWNYHFLPNNPHWARGSRWAVDNCQAMRWHFSPLQRCIPSPNQYRIDRLAEPGQRIWATLSNGYHRHCPHHTQPPSPPWNLSAD